MDHGIKPWYRESALYAVLALSLGAFFLRGSLLPVLGEEPRRGVIAREMIETGDWLVPRVQGIELLSRPPMQNWLIMAASCITGRVDAWAIRLPSVVSMLLTVLLVYGYTRRFAGTSTAVLAACAFTTMYESLEYGRLGETDAVFTIFVASSLLLWDWGFRDGWNRWVLWSVCYGLVAIGMLTKGLQAPLYFGGTIGLILLFTGKWRELFSLPHLFGLAFGLVCLAAWEIPFIQRLGWQSAYGMYFNDVAGRFEQNSTLKFVGHFLTYPLEIFACMLPWSLLLLPAIQTSIREQLRPHRETLRFLLIATLWSFIFVWLPSGSRTRYFMPLMPCIAVMIGLIGHAWVAARWRAISEMKLRRVILATSASLAAIYLGIVMPLLAAHCENVEQQVALLKEKLPADARLVSFGQLHHCFLYHFNQPVKYEPLPENQNTLRGDEEYFAIHTYRHDLPELPFAWEPIQDISCDRYHHANPRDVIHVIRRVIDSNQVAEMQNVVPQ